MFILRTQEQSAKQRLKFSLQLSAIVRYSHPRHLHPRLNFASLQVAYKQEIACSERTNMDYSSGPSHSPH